MRITSKEQIQDVARDIAAQVNFVTQIFVVQTDLFHADFYPQKVFATQLLEMPLLTRS